MANRDDIKKQIKKQNDDFYGDETASGSSPGLDTDDDTVKNLEDTVGTKIKPGDEFYLADEVIEDEEERRGLNQDATNEREEDSEDSDDLEEPDEDIIDEEEEE